MALLIRESNDLPHSSIGGYGVEKYKKQRPYISQCRLFYSIDYRENKKGSCNMDEFSDSFAFNQMELIENKGDQSLQTHI